MDAIKEHTNDTINCETVTQRILPCGTPSSRVKSLERTRPTRTRIRRSGKNCQIKRGRWPRRPDSYKLCRMPWRQAVSCFLQIEKYSHLVVIIGKRPANGGFHFTTLNWRQNSANERCPRRHTSQSSSYTRPVKNSARCSCLSLRTHRTPLTAAPASPPRWQGVRHGWGFYTELILWVFPC